MVEKMTENENKKYDQYLKVAWAIYTLLALLVIVVLVFAVAEDNEEKLFYSLMAAAVSYVFRPTEKFFRKLIARIMSPTEKIDDK